MPMNKLQSALPDLIGRTIEHIVVSEHENGRTQLFLFFEDGTHYEFYGGWLNGSRQLTLGRIEIVRAGGYIPARGRLEILDGSRTRLTERPAPPATADAPAMVSSKRKRWRRTLESWLR